MMFTRFVPLCIISTMNDAEDYAGLDNDGVVVSVQLSSAPRECLGLQGYCDCDFSVSPSPIPLELGWGLGT